MTLHSTAVQRRAWWKCSKYILDADVLRPSDNALFEQYDPWVEYEATEGKRRTVIPPYASVLNLSRQLQFRPRPNAVPSYAPTDDSVSRVQDWCRDYGLLGVLPAQCRRITLAATWLEVRRQGALTWLPGYLTYLWSGEEWVTIPTLNDTNEARQWPDSDKGCGRPVPPHLCRPEWPKPGVLLWEWRNLDWVDEPLTKRFSTFFPSVSPHTESYQYPVPCSPEFWRLYGEPVESFVFWLERFREAAEVLSSFDLSQKYDAEYWEVFDTALSFINRLVNATGTVRLGIAR